MKSFEAGKNYQTRSICDHNCIFTAKVLKRTAKTVTVITDQGEARCKIHTDDEGEEFFFPYGRYSMAPVIKASRLTA